MMKLRSMIMIFFLLLNCSSCSHKEDKTKTSAHSDQWVEDIEGLFRAQPSGDVFRPIPSPRMEDLLAALEDKSPQVRMTAARHLGRIKDNRALPPLIALLDDENSQVRGSAVIALSKFKDPRIENPLLAALKDRDQHVREITEKVFRSLYDEHRVTAKVIRIFSTSHLAIDGFKKDDLMRMTHISVEILDIGPVVLKHCLPPPYKKGEVFVVRATQDKTDEILRPGDVITAHLYMERCADGDHFSASVIKRIKEN